ncbi:MAG TPA: hypothetical protein VEJ20_07050 [Candidatus Eremiobacteraceae bacterium]|nr:hypothetical protein [Candidatus Eremiobacteraceae bacterium]
MRRFALIGDPVAHSLSPAMQNAAFAAAGIDARYDAIDVPLRDLAPWMTDKRSEYAGLNVTTPLKEAVVTFVDGMTAEALAVGAANTLRIEKGRVTAHNTDGAGFVAALQDMWKLSPRGRSVCIFGSGPAARAVAVALRRGGVATLACWSRNPLTASEIGPAPDSTPDLLINALPAQAVVPDDVIAVVRGARHVVDLNYRAERSPIPPGIGAHRTDGLPLLLHQGALAFEWWFGQPAPLDAMRDALANS